MEVPMSFATSIALNSYRAKLLGPHDFSCKLSQKLSLPGDAWHHREVLTHHHASKPQLPSLRLWLQVVCEKLVRTTASPPQGPQTAEKKIRAHAARLQIRLCQFFSDAQVDLHVAPELCLIQDALAKAYMASTYGV